MTTPPPQDEQGLDLSAMRSPRGGEAPAAQQGGQAAGGPGPDQVSVPALVFDATEETFESVVKLSMDIPIVIDLWATWCGPCKQLSPVIERVVEDSAGKVLLAKVDVDANPRLQQIFQVQSIPTVIALVKGQPVPLFQGAQPEPQVREIISQLITLAGQQGMTKTAYVSGAEPAPAGPKHPEAIEALEAGDLDKAAEVYKAALAESPADDEAKQGLARVELLRRTRGQDLAAVRQAAAADPADVEAAMTCADLDVSGGHVEDAFARLIKTISLTHGDDREQARVRLLELFEAVGADDPRVVKARGQLMRALF